MFNLDVIFAILREYWLWIAIGVFILSDFIVIAKTGTEIFVHFFRLLYRRARTSEEGKCIKIPSRLQPLVSSETISVNSIIKVVHQLPLVADPEYILMTSNEAKYPEGSILYVHEITKHTFLVAPQKLDYYTPVTSQEDSSQQSSKALATNEEIAESSPPFSDAK